MSWHTILKNWKRNRKVSPYRTHILKAAIRHRLYNEDYTCRLPRPPRVKPRVRYKLRTTRHWGTDQVYWR